MASAPTSAMKSGYSCFDASVWRSVNSQPRELSASAMNPSMLVAV